jgi:hypothetical protein
MLITTSPVCIRSPYLATGEDSKPWLQFIVACEDTCIPRLA